MCGPMGVGWQDSGEVLARLLREHGQEPSRVTSVEAAWQAFLSFLNAPIDGLETGRDNDADGFIVQWGCYGWNDGHPSLAFTRQMAVDVRATWTEPDWYQPELWRLNLELVFDDLPALADVDQLRNGDTGFDFSPPGPEQDHAGRKVRRVVRQNPAVQALWASTPVRSSLTLGNAD
jgi:hypothetical protein